MWLTGSHHRCYYLPTVIIPSSPHPASVHRHHLRTTSANHRGHRRCYCCRPSRAKIQGCSMDPPLRDELHQPGRHEKPSPHRRLGTLPYATALQELFLVHPPSWPLTICFEVCLFASVKKKIYPSTSEPSCWILRKSSKWYR